MAKPIYFISIMPTFRLSMPSGVRDEIAYYTFIGEYVLRRLASYYFSPRCRVASLETELAFSMSWNISYLEHYFIIYYVKRVRYSVSSVSLRRGFNMHESEFISEYIKLSMSQAHLSPLYSINTSFIMAAFHRKKRETRQLSRLSSACAHRVLQTHKMVIGHQAGIAWDIRYIIVIAYRLLLYHLSNRELLRYAVMTSSPRVSNAPRCGIILRNNRFVFFNQFHTGEGNTTPS